MTKRIGTSLSKCVKSIALGEVDIKDVIFITTNTAYENYEALQDGVRFIMRDENLDKYLSIIHTLHYTGRIFQSTHRAPAGLPVPIWINIPDVQIDPKWPYKDYELDNP